MFFRIFDDIFQYAYETKKEEYFRKIKYLE
jgi:hypothetical protein